MTAFAFPRASARALTRMPASIVAAGGLALASLFNLAALLLWVRWLGPAAFGSLALLGAAGLLANALAFEWLRLAGARLLIVHGQVSPAILADWVRAGAVTTTLLITLAVTATVLGRLAPFGLQPGWTAAVVMLALGEMMIGAVMLVERLRLRPWRFAALLVGRAVLSLAGGIVAVASGAGVAGIVGAMIAAPIAVALTVMARDPLWRLAFAFRPTGLRPLLSLGALLLPASLLQLAASLADRLLAGALLGSAAAGALAAPSDLVARTLGFAMMALNLTAYPTLVRLFDGDDPAATARALRRNGLTLLAVGIPIAATFVLLAGPLTALLLGPSYRTTAALLPWLAGAALLRLVAAFHYGVRFQLERRMALLLPGPAVALLLLLCGAPAAVSADGLLGLAKLGFVAQTAGLAVSALLARRLVTPRKR